jgi:hypothetical protein
MIDEANMYDWKAPGGAIEKYKECYLKLTESTIQIPNLKIYPQSPDKDHLVQYLGQQFGMYPPKKILFVYDKFYPFILSTLAIGTREKETSFNLKNLKELTRVQIKDKKLYLNDEKETLFDTNLLKEKNASFFSTWVINKKGELFAGAFCHPYFLKSKPGSPYYGYGKPIACGGDFLVKNGTIDYIDDRSGHYLPRKHQFLLVLHYLYTLGLIDEKCTIKEETSGELINLKEIIDIDIVKIVSNYSSLTNCTNSLQ